MNMGKAIRENRLRRNMTQERLACRLNVTAQAVSRWESGQGCPDIALLPELSAVLGVTIDELFACSSEQHLERIEAMVERETMLPRADFDYAMARAQEGAHGGENRGRCLTLLADLCMHRANGYADMAADYARQALTEEPEKKANHALLGEAMHGGLWDWCATNHTRIIDYYKVFTREHPDYAPGYMWLLDSLIKDGRLDEARTALGRLRALRGETDYHIGMYAGWIAFAAGDHVQADRLWDGMVADNPENWFAWSTRADAYAKQARYDDAIRCYREAIARQTPPRYTDNEESIAQICRICGDREGAAQAYEHVVQILREDWGITEGETLEGYLLNIKELRKKE